LSDGPGGRPVKYSPTATGYGGCRTNEGKLFYSHSIVDGGFELMS
jgi:hypothetical protein